MPRPHFAMYVKTYSSLWWLWYKSKQPSSSRVWKPPLRFGNTSVQWQGFAVEWLHLKGHLITQSETQTQEWDDLTPWVKFSTSSLTLSHSQSRFNRSSENEGEIMSERQREKYGERASIFPGCYWNVFACNPGSHFKWVIHIFCGDHVGE